MRIEDEKNWDVTVLIVKRNINRKCGMNYPIRNLTSEEKRSIEEMNYRESVKEFYDKTLNLLS